MGVLARRVFRLIKTSPGQFIALCTIVMLGVLIYIAMTTAFYNLSQSQLDFYHKTRFADYFFQVVKAPTSVVGQVQYLPGVARASAKIQMDVAFIKPQGGRGILRLNTYDLNSDDELNGLQVINGRNFNRDGSQETEVLVDPQFARANNLEQGGILQVIAGGKVVSLKVIGTAASPEFIYIMKDSASLLPDPREFGVLMMPYQQAERILNMQGQFNQVSVQMAPGTDPDDLKKRVQEILRPYGNLAAYPRDQQMSHAVLKSELQQLEVSSLFLPLFFFLIAAGIQFLLLGRMIKNQRSTIGVLKALGYSSFRIIGHYVSYALSISLTGSLLGSIFGIALASVFSQMYGEFFNLPEVIGGLNLTAIIYSLGLSLAVGGFSGLLAARSIIKIRPAEAMRSKAPVIGRRVWLEKWPRIWARLNSSWRMSLRSIMRNHTRVLVTVLGVCSTVVLLILALFFNDAIDYMMKRHFQEENRYDYLVQLTHPIKTEEILYWNQWEEIKNIEPVLEVPVSIRKPGGSREENGVIYGLNPGQDVVGIYSAEDLEQVIPEEGVVLNERIARKIGVQVGDVVGIETRMNQGNPRNAELKVVGISQALMGGGSYVSLTTANRLLGERGLFSRALARLDLGQSERFENRLESMTSISSIVSRAEEKAGWDKMMASGAASIAIMVMFAGLLGMAITYNATLMNFNERQRELASMRVLGYTLGELRRLLFQEILVQASIGIIIGLPLGRWLGSVYLSSVSTDFYSMPFIIYPRTYALTALTAMVFIILGFALVLPRLKKIDLVEALKSTD